jgi:hypothetical protein
MVVVLLSTAAAARRRRRLSPVPDIGSFDLMDF